MFLGCCGSFLGLGYLLASPVGVYGTLCIFHSLEIICLLIFLQGSLIYFPFSMNFENLLLLVLFYSLYIYFLPILNKGNCLLLLDDLLEIIIHVVCDNYVLSLSLSTPNLPHGLWRKG